MHKLSITSNGLSRRRFMAGTASAALVVSSSARAADFRCRLGSSQPADSPNVVRQTQMADNIRAETGGRTCRR